MEVQAMRGQLSKLALDHAGIGRGGLREDQDSSAANVDSNSDAGRKLIRKASSGVVGKWQGIKEEERKRQEEVLQRQQSAKARVQELISARKFSQQDSVDEGGEGLEAKAKAQKEGSETRDPAQEAQKQDAHAPKSGSQRAWAVAQLEGEKVKQWPLSERGVGEKKQETREVEKQDTPRNESRVARALAEIQGKQKQEAEESKQHTPPPESRIAKALAQFQGDPSKQKQEGNKKKGTPSPESKSAQTLAQLQGEKGRQKQGVERKGSLVKSEAQETGTQEAASPKTQMAWAVAQLQEEKAKRSLKAKKTREGLTPLDVEDGQEGCESTPKGSRQRAWAVAQLQGSLSSTPPPAALNFSAQKGLGSADKGKAPPDRSQSGFKVGAKGDAVEGGGLKAMEDFKEKVEDEKTGRAEMKKEGQSAEGQEDAEAHGEGQRAWALSQLMKAMEKQEDAKEAAGGGLEEQRRAERQRALAVAKWLEENSRSSRWKREKPLVRQSTEKVAERAAFFLQKLGGGEAGHSPQKVAAAAVTVVEGPEGQLELQTDAAVVTDSPGKGPTIHTAHAEQALPPVGNEPTKQDAADLEEQAPLGSSSSKQVSKTPPQESTTSNPTSSSDLRDWELVAKPASRGGSPGEGEPDQSNLANNLVPPEVQSVEPVSKATPTWMVGPGVAGTGRVGTEEERADHGMRLSEKAGGAHQEEEEEEEEEHEDDVNDLGITEELQRQVEEAIVAAERASRKDSKASLFDESFMDSTISPITRFIGISTWAESLPEKTAEAKPQPTRPAEDDNYDDDDDISVTELVNNITSSISSIFSKFTETSYLKSPRTPSPKTPPSKKKSSKKAPAGIPIIDF